MNTQRIFWALILVSSLSLAISGGLYYIRSAERDKVQVKLNERLDERRGIIRETLDSNRPNDINDATDSLQFLESR